MITLRKLQLKDVPLMLEWMHDEEAKHIFQNNFAEIDDVAAKNALESYLLDYATQSTDGDDKQAADTGVLETDANGIASKDKLALGLYLMVETKVPEQVTSTVNPWQS